MTITTTIEHGRRRFLVGPLIRSAITSARRQYPDRPAWYGVSLVFGVSRDAARDLCSAFEVDSEGCYQETRCEANR